MDNETFILSLDKTIEKMECEPLHEHSYIENEKLYISFCNEEFDVEGASLPINIEGWKLVDIKMSTTVMSHRLEYWTNATFTLVFERA